MTSQTTRPTDHRRVNNAMQATLDELATWDLTPQELLIVASDIGADLRAQVEAHDGVHEVNAAQLSEVS